MKPNFAITNESRLGDFTIVTIDTTQATYQGMAWLSMGDFGKRKFENFLVLSRLPERVKLIYA